MSRDCALCHRSPQADDLQVNQHEFIARPLQSGSVYVGHSAAPPYGYLARNRVGRVQNRTEPLCLLLDDRISPNIHECNVIGEL